MSSFLQYGNVYPEVQSTITSRAGNNLEVSKLKPWIRIASSLGNGLVVGSNLPDDNFATRYGEPVTTRNQDYPSNSGRLGLDFNGTSIYPRVNSFDRSNRPSPVIEAISIQNGTEGLSRKLTFTIKAFTLPQLDALTAYFLEPRFYLLVEWGNNTQLAYNQMAKLTGGISAGSCEMVSYVNLAVLKDKRKNSRGHYDAFLGVITGGGVEYGSDETYLVNVEVTTQGEIPAYLQQHKGTAVKLDTAQTNPAKSSDTFDVTTEIKIAEDAVDYGRALFMYMYNDLPLSKRTERIKRLIDLKTDDPIPQPIWATEYNFINMNKTTRDSLISDLQDETVLIKNREGAEGKGKVPEGQPLVGKERFIRMELAWEILNTSDLILGPQLIGCDKGGKSNKSLDSTISIENTIIRAHKHIFSTDKRYLYIPNEQAPDFGLYDILTTTTDLSGSSNFVKFEDGSLLTQNLKPTGLPGDSNFPQPGSCNISGIQVFDESVFAINQDPYEWGYLKDLFVNFDFFCECMQKNGFVIKDVALDILNGLSSAVNLFWDFQIVETGSTSSTKGNTGDMCLIVVDKNFSGKPPKNEPGLLSLQSIGTNSPFLDFKMKLELVGAMANQVMAQTNQSQQDLATSTPSPSYSSYNIEDKVENFQGLFANKPDTVGRLLNTIHKESLEIAQKEAEQIEQNTQTETEKTQEMTQQFIDALVKKAETEAITGAQVTFLQNWAYGLILSGDADLAIQGGQLLAKTYYYATTSVTAEASNYVTEGESRKETAARTSNYEIFMQKAGVYPKTNNPNINAYDWESSRNNDTLVIDESTMVCAIWEDTQLLRQIYEYDLTGGNLITFNEGANKNPGFLPIEVNFTIHGVSGIKVGDMLHFVDLPRVYRTKIFSVFDVEHSINDDMWQTSVVAKLRNIDVKTFIS
jgi:hypothetical protein